MKILMVCLGNICRSPMAEGILKKKAQEKGLKIVVDSAGTGAWHEGEHPDRRAVLTARKFGVDISQLVARQFCEDDFDSFDSIYVMDSSNYTDVLQKARSAKDRGKVKYLLETINPEMQHEIPDPYYGGHDGFIEVFQMMDKACEKILEELENSYKV